MENSLYILRSVPYDSLNPGHWLGTLLALPLKLYNLHKGLEEKLIQLERYFKVLGYIHGDDLSSSYPHVPLVVRAEDTPCILTSKQNSKIQYIGVKQSKTNSIVPDFLIPRGIYRKIAIIHILEPLYGQKFYKLSIKTEEDSLFLAGLLNNTFTYSFLLSRGQTLWKDGALTFNKPDIQSSLLPNINLFTTEHKQKIASFIKVMGKRQYHDIFTECGIDPKSDIPISEQEPNPLPDRKALDDVVFDALGLTEEERKEVYRAVCQLVWDRIP